MSNIFDDKSIYNRNKIYEIPPDTMILREGEINLDMYKIVSGHVEMYTGYGTPNEVLIGLLGPGTCFGEFGILTGQPAIYTIITYSKTKILRVTEGLMGDFIQENKDDILQIMRNMATNMTRMQHQINQLSRELEEVTENRTKRDTANNKDDSVIEILRSDNLQKDNLRNYALNTPEKQMREKGMHFIGKRKNNN
ncbi:MAG: Crp/Fnr family transcriptional regulator [Pseudobutyrivibrio sp.]|uniref:Crp/Fnr family transcriptional regulator n=1 Tax=Pseudobutyrivibrio sp. TaxID=2014367 RepID=UPI001B164910|nr:cyclic nucleotide-binding domain-containing protein [Pseudobutyrivibrio sp.]MBO6283030.1 Crp/Fnr family transcriptional regulator [Pseudobutyrivibrio sp.]MBP3262545.1 Crp/Fnr family transcriptional regulator [Pseudobutyrivibrio sp.]